jgi:cytochrome P450
MPATIEQAPTPLPLSSMPSVRGHGVWGVLREIRGDPLGLYAAARRDHGDVVRLRILGGLLHLIVLADPDGVEHVLSRNHANYRKPAFLLDAIRVVGGEGLFTSQGAPWKRKRRLIAPAFRRDRLLGMAPGIVSVADDHTTRWADRDLSQPYDVLDDLAHLTLDVASTVFFGSTLGDDREAFAAGMREATEQISQRLNGPSLPLWIPTRANRSLRRVQAAMRGAVLRLLEAGTSSGPDAPDMMTRLLAAGTDEADAQSLSKSEVVDEMLTLLVAGHDTSAAGLAWTLHLLAHNPAARDAVEEEIDRVLDGRPPTAEDLPNLQLTRMAFEEALRLYPPAWGQAREAIADDVLCGYAIPKGTLVMPSQWVLHRHPDYWPDPERFDPQRFTPEQVATRPRFAYFPFGGGPHLCVGRALALLEAPLLLAVLLSRFRFESTEVPVEPDCRFTLRPQRLVMRVVPRGA